MASWGKQQSWEEGRGQCGWGARARRRETRDLEQLAEAVEGASAAAAGATAPATETVAAEISALKKASKVALTAIQQLQAQSSGSAGGPDLESLLQQAQQASTKIAGLETVVGGVQTALAACEATVSEQKERVQSVLGRIDGLDPHLYHAIQTLTAQFAQRAAEQDQEMARIRGRMNGLEGVLQSLLGQVDALQQPAAEGRRRRRARSPAGSDMPEEGRAQGAGRAEGSSRSVHRREHGTS